MKSMTPVDSFKKRMDRIASSLRKVLKDAQEIWPEANLYIAEDVMHLMYSTSHKDEKPNFDNIAEDVMHLMSGTSHNKDEKPNFDNIITSNHIPTMGGGDW